MRRAWALADRHHAVRTAARDWRSAGIIDDTILAEVAARFPDDRVRPGLVMRLLLFVFALIASSAVIGLIETMGRIDWFGLALLGGVFAAATEVQIGPLRRAGGGAEEACSLFAVGLITVAGASDDLIRALSLAQQHVPTLVGVVLAAAAGAAAWRWGMPAWGAVAAIGLFIAIAPTAKPRVMWCVIVAATLIPLERAYRSARLCPAHREVAGWTMAAGIALAYLACNVRSVDGAWVEVFRHGSHHVAFDRTVAIFITTLAPFAALAAGVRRRDRLWLALGGAMLVASAVTLRSYVHIAPTWAVLILAGGALVAVAGLVQRLLASGFNHERGGLTAEPLFEGRFHETAEVVAVLATVAPSAQPRGDTPGPAPVGPRVDPGGGSFGGGGASESF